MTKYVKIDGKECLNMASSNFLGFVGDRRIEVGIEGIHFSLLFNHVKRSFFDFLICVFISWHDVMHEMGKVDWVMRAQRGAVEGG